MKEIHEATDRYQALGIPYPDPKTCCDGQCEGIGCYPVKMNLLSLKERYLGTKRTVDLDSIPCLAEFKLWNKEHDKGWFLKRWWHKLHCDGWHFITCPDCNGTGKRKDDETNPDSFT